MSRDLRVEFEDSSNFKAMVSHQGMKGVEGRTVEEKNRMNSKLATPVSPLKLQERERRTMKCRLKIQGACLLLCHSCSFFCGHKTEITITISFSVNLFHTWCIQICFYSYSMKRNGFSVLLQFLKIVAH